MWKINYGDQALPISFLPANLLEKGVYFSGSLGTLLALGIHDLLMEADTELSSGKNISVCWSEEFAINLSADQLIVSLHGLSGALFLENVKAPGMTLGRLEALNALRNKLGFLAVEERDAFGENPKKMQKADTDMILRSMDDPAREIAGKQSSIYRNFLLDNINGICKTNLTLLDFLPYGDLQWDGMVYELMRSISPYMNIFDEQADRAKWLSVKNDILSDPQSPHYLPRTKKPGAKRWSRMAKRDCLHVIEQAENMSIYDHITLVRSMVTG